MDLQIFDELKRMNKRQVNQKFYTNNQIRHFYNILLFLKLALLPSTQLRNDSFDSFDDLERSYGCDWF